MLAELLSHERALLEFVLAQLDTRSLAMCARAAHWLHATALETAEQRVAHLIQTEPRVARWRRTSAVGSSAVLREAHHIEAGVQYVVRISGRYRLDTNVVLDIAPTGDYVNYSTASLEAPGHCFRGVATVAGVLPSPDASVDFLYLFDRGYSTCIFDGVKIPAARLPFVRDNYQCFSVSCLREGGVRDGRPCPVLYENEPGPVAEVAWAVPSGMASVAWRPLPGEVGPAPAPNTPEPEPSLRSLRHVAERVAEWGGGLAPLADTRCDATLPARQDFDLRLADLRAAQSTA